MTNMERSNNVPETLQDFVNAGATWVIHGRGNAEMAQSCGLDIDLLYNRQLFGFSVGDLANAYNNFYEVEDEEELNPWDKLSDAAKLSHLQAAQRVFDGAETGVALAVLEDTFRLVNFTIASFVCATCSFRFVALEPLREHVHEAHGRDWGGDVAAEG